ncbi:glycoside hydrolase family 43 protein [Roseateles sp.]|uniref:glycoside hydrolase family 43 protein n=1 Tax=Roseateles sp. TaxID=1971397 RepID=UPI0039E75EAC
MSRNTFLYIAVLFGIFITGCTTLKHDDDATRSSYLFVHFVKNGADGLHLAVSNDGYRWEKVNSGRTVLVPKVGKERLIRDPNIILGKDGTFHMVWTTGWNASGIGYSSSRDLLNWTDQREIPVMAHEPNVLNAWAPEIIFDEKADEFLIHWASTVPGKFENTAGTSEKNYNHRIYSTTTKDFQHFGKTRLFYDPGFSVIDATLLRFNGRQYWFAKDETVNPPKKYLQFAEVDSIQGAIGRLGKPMTPGGLWVEGPTAIQIGEYAVVYFDAYQRQFYGALRSKDLINWEDVTSQISLPDEGTPLRVRHGTIITIPRELAGRLRNSQINLGVPP